MQVVTLFCQLWPQFNLHPVPSSAVLGPIDFLQKPLAAFVIGDKGEHCERGSLCIWYVPRNWPFVSYISLPHIGLCHRDISLWHASAVGSTSSALPAPNPSTPLSLSHFCPFWAIFSSADVIPSTHCPPHPNYIRSCTLHYTVYAKDIICKWHIWWHLAKERGSAENRGRGRILCFVA